VKFCPEKKKTTKPPKKTPDTISPITAGCFNLLNK